MIQSLQQLFEQNGYSRITSNVEGLTLYIRKEETCAQVIMTYVYEEDSLTKPQYEARIRQVKEFVQNKYQLASRVLTLIITDRVSECKKFVLDDGFCWILDRQNRRLLIYENQIKDFNGARTMLEDWCVSTGGTSAGNPFAEYQDEPLPEKGSFWKNNVSPVNSVLVLLNVGIFIWLSIIGSTTDLDFMLEKGVMYMPAVLQNKEYWRFLTCIFLHFGIQHLMGNMVALFFLGDNVERVMGWWRYLLLYLLSGVIGSVGSFLSAYYFKNEIVSAGASGAIFGIYGALLALVILNRGRLENITIFRIGLLIVYALYSGLVSDHVDNAAHIFGLVAGFILAMILYRRPGRMAKKGQSK